MPPIKSPPRPPDISAMATGLVANFCPVCADILPFTILPARGSFDRAIIEQCTQCGVRFQTDRDTLLNVAHERLPLPDLITHTRPHLPAEYLGSIARLRRLIAGEATPHERTLMLRFHPSNLPKLEPDLAEFDNARIRLILACCASVVIGPILAHGAWLFIRSNLPPLFHWLNTIPNFQTNAIGVSCLLPGAVYVLIAMLNRNIARARNLEPLLARALRPYRPTPQELDQLFTYLRDTRSPIAPLLKRKSLQAAIAKLTDVSLRNIDEFNLEAMGREYIAKFLADHGDDDREWDEDQWDEDEVA